MLIRILFFLIVFTLFTPISSAQLIQLEDTLVVDISPENPRSLQDVRIRIESYSIDLNSATISWSINGIIKKQSKGDKEFFFTTGKLGSKTTLDILVSTDVGFMTRTIEFAPTNVHMIVEPLTYTPPTYKGRALPTYMSDIKIVAMPQFKSGNTLLDPSTLIYTWKKNGRVLGDESGYGKQTLIINDDSYVRGAIEIYLEVHSTDQTLSGAGATRIERVEPMLLFYEHNPLLGTLYERALPDTFVLKNDEFTLYTEPFYFSTSNRNNSDFSYKWTLNNLATSAFNNPAVMTLRRAGEGAGQTILGLILQNNKEVLQGAKKNITINFEAKTGSKLFSF